MPKTPDSKPKSKKEPVFTPEEGHFRIQIERELMERLLKENKKSFNFEKIADKFRNIFNPKKDEWLKLYKKDPEALLNQLQKLIDGQP